MRVKAVGMTALSLVILAGCSRPAPPAPALVAALPTSDHVMPRYESECWFGIGSISGESSGVWDTPDGGRLRAIRETRIGGENTPTGGDVEAAVVGAKFVDRQGEADRYEITWSVKRGGRQSVGSETVGYTGKPVSVGVLGGGSITVRPPAN